MNINEYKITIKLASGGFVWILCYAPDEETCRQKMKERQAAYEHEVVAVEYLGPKENCFGYWDSLVLEDGQ